MRWQGFVDVKSSLNDLSTAQQVRHLGFSKCDDGVTHSSCGSHVADSVVATTFQIHMLTACRVQSHRTHVGESRVYLPLKVILRVSTEGVQTSESREPGGKLSPVQNSQQCHFGVEKGLSIQSQGPWRDCPPREAEITIWMLSTQYTAQNTIWAIIFSCPRQNFQKFTYNNQEHRVQWPKW